MGRDGDLVERDNLHARQRGIGNSGAADQRLELPLVLLKTGFGIDQILPAGGELRFRRGHVQLDQRSNLHLLPGVCNECLRGFEGAGLGLHVFIVGD